MTIKAIVIEPAGQTRLLEMTPGQTLRPLQEAVGGYIERVSSADEVVDFWVNEEGKVHGLPVNPAATALLYKLNPAFVNQDILVGPVVLTGGGDGDGETLGVPAFLLEAFGFAQ